MEAARQRQNRWIEGEVSVVDVEVGVETYW